MNDVRVVIDTNVLISRLLLPHSTAGRAVRRLIDRAQALVSEATLGDLAQTLSRDKFNPYVSLGDRQEFFRLFARLAEWVPVTTTIRACGDPQDDQLLALAVDSEAHLIVTGDKDLIALSPFRKILVVTPARVLAMRDSAFG